MKHLFLLFVVLIANSFFAQNSSKLSNYRYILLPNTFSFQNKAHEYNLNKLTQFLFNKYDFETYIEGGENSRLSTANPCEILRVNSFMQGVFKSKATFTFTDCRGKLIYTSSVGVSSKKEYDKSYTEAIRDVFKVDKNINTHKYLKRKEEKTKETFKVKKTITSSKVSNLDTNNKPSLELELRGKKYSFVLDSETTYSIFLNTVKIGDATLKDKDKEGYIINAGALSGEGRFDDFGNFELKRINPASNKELLDVMVRTR